MSVTAHRIYTAEPTPAPLFAEIDSVRLKRDVESHSGRTIKAGTVGTVVLVHSGGIAFEVEFGPEPDQLASVVVEDLDPA